MSIGPARPRLPKAVPSPAAPTQRARSSGADSPMRAKSFMEVLSEGRRQNPPPSGSSPSAAAGPVRTPVDSPVSRVVLAGNPSRSGLRSIFERALQAETKVDALIAAAARGRTFGAGELIALQATVFRYSQTVEVISRAADRLVGSIKQTLGTQV